MKQTTLFFLETKVHAKQSQQAAPTPEARELLVQWEARGKGGRQAERKASGRKEKREEVRKGARRQEKEHLGI